MYHSLEVLMAVGVLRLGRFRLIRRREPKTIVCPSTRAKSIKQKHHFSAAKEEKRVGFKSACRVVCACIESRAPTATRDQLSEV